MDFETAKAFIDHLLSSGEMRYSESVIIEFIGGEPLIEVGLINRICDYFKLAAFKLDQGYSLMARVHIRYLQ